MKYQAPYGSPGGPNDWTAVYINGNPSTGTMGSIPPAASIENPQREIVNLITDAGAVPPADTDLHQLGKSVQSCKVNYSADGGLANEVILALVPVPDAYYPGMVVRFVALHAPNGPMTLDAGRGAKPIIKAAGAVLTGGEWSVNDVVTVTYTGSAWQLPTSGVAMLYANRDYYVATTGLDTNDGLSAGTPFATLQKAWNTSQLFNLNGYNVTIHVADGTYNQKVAGGQINGSGLIIFKGNTPNPQNVVVSTATGPAMGFGGASAVLIDGFRVQSNAPAPGYPSAGVWASGGASVYLNAVDFGQAYDGQIISAGGGTIGIYGPIRITGSAPAHIYAGAGYLQLMYPAPTLQILNSVAFSLAFAFAVNNGTANNMGYASIAGAAFVTGPKYNVSANGVINTGGAGVNYFPGTVAGSVSTGGQYV